MSNTNDGGPVFPTTLSHWNGASIERGPGLSLRDYFAAKADPRQIFAEGGLPKWVAEIHMGCAMPATGKCPADNAAAEEWWMNALAWWKYRMADAMLRAKGGTEFAEQAKLSVLVGACEGLLAIIHDDLTHERQRGHAEAIDAAHKAIAAAKGGG